MDDGSIQNKGLHLNVYGFTLDEVIKLKITLENLFILHAIWRYSTRERWYQFLEPVTMEWRRWNDSLYCLNKQ